MYLCHTLCKIFLCFSKTKLPIIEILWKDYWYVQHINVMFIAWWFSASFQCVGLPNIQDDPCPKSMLHHENYPHLCPMYGWFGSQACTNVSTHWILSRLWVEFMPVVTKWLNDYQIQVYMYYIACQLFHWNASSYMIGVSREGKKKPSLVWDYNLAVTGICLWSDYSFISQPSPAPFRGNLITNHHSQVS